MNKNEYLLIVFNTIVEFYRSVVEKHEEEKKNFIVFLDSPMMHGDGAWYAYGTGIEHLEEQMKWSVFIRLTRSMFSSLWVVMSAIYNESATPPTSTVADCLLNFKYASLKQFEDDDVTDIASLHATTLRMYHKYTEEFFETEMFLKILSEAMEKIRD